MKVTIFVSLTAATMAANCIRQVAQDNGVTIPDMVMHQLPNIIISLVGEATAFLAWLCHHNIKKAQNSTIASLVESNQTLAAGSTAQSAVQKPI